MTRNRIALAAATAAAALILPAVPANAHGTCDVYAGDPFETYYNGSWVIGGEGQLSCSDPHTPSSYSLNICINYSPVVPPTGTIVVTGVPVPDSRPAACGFASEKWDYGAYGAVYVECPYLPGYYQVKVFNGRAGTHSGIVDKFDYSPWVFFSGANCGL